MVVSDLRGCFEIKPGKGGHGTEASIRFTQSRVSGDTSPTTLNVSALNVER